MLLILHSREINPSWFNLSLQLILFDPGNICNLLHPPQSLHMLPAMGCPELQTLCWMLPHQSFIQLQDDLPTFILNGPTREGTNTLHLFFCLIYLRCQLQGAMDLHAKVHQCCERSCHLSSLFLTLKLWKCYILNLSWLNSICHVSAHIFQLIYILVYPLTTFLTILQRCQSCVVCKFTNQRIDLEIAPRLQWELVFLIES